VETRRPGARTSSSTAARTLQLVGAGPGAGAGAGAGTTTASGARSGSCTATGRAPGTGQPDGSAPCAPAPAQGPGGPLVDALEDVVAALQVHGPASEHRTALTDLLGAWAAGLVTLHARPVAADVRAVPRPWVLAHDPLPRWLGELPVEAGPAWAVREHPRVRAALAEAREDWVTADWVNGGDADDVVLADAPGPHRTEPEADLHRDATAGPAGGVGSDAAPSHPTGRSRAAHASPDELGPAHRPEVTSPVSTVPGAGRGDARWDVASALDWIAVNLVPALDAAWDLDPVTSFMTAYRACGGRAEPTRAMAVARTVTTAIEWSLDLGPEGTAGASDLRWLAALWGRPLTLVAAAGRRR
jgi:hypothetical protein